MAEKRRKSNSMAKPQYGRKSEENQIQWQSLSMAEKVKKIKFNGKASVWQKK